MNCFSPIAAVNVDLLIKDDFCDFLFNYTPKISNSETKKGTGVERVLISLLKRVKHLTLAGFILST